MPSSKNKEGQEPWSQPIIERMPQMVNLDVPNGVAKDKGREAGQTKSWDGNRTGE